MNAIFSAIGISAGTLILVAAVATAVVMTAMKRGDAQLHRVPERSIRARIGIRGNLITRRSWISWVALAWTAFTASALAGAASAGRFMFPNVLFEPPATFKAGFPSEIQQGQVDTRFKQRYGVWLVRDIDPITGAKGIFALSDICTHLGCIPNWLQDEQKFKCPCHGSGYYKNGINFEGPTPRPLERFAISLADDGQILVDKNQKFQYEKGEWTKPQSFFKFG
jgi:cytochrome b6-f complex iron-sulfur subunit